MEYKGIEVRKREGAAWIIFNRPLMMNAFDLEAVDEFAGALDELGNDESVKVVVLTGAGRAFCAGGDFNFFLSLRAQDSQTIKHFITEVNKVVLKIVNQKKVVIASVNGDAMGGGCSFALASDLIIASEKARFGMTFIKIGLVPDTGATYLLPRIVGPLKANELLMSGNIINAPEALQFGMVNRVVPADQLERVTAELAQKLSGNPPMAMGIIKALVHKSVATDDLATALEYETDAQIGCLQSETFNALIQNFLKKAKSWSKEEPRGTHGDVNVGSFNVTG